MTLTVGDAAPDVSASNYDSEHFTPAFDQPHSRLLLPRNNTPGCTTEAQQFDQEYKSYREAGVTVYGISTDDVASHRTFAEQEDLECDLLALDLVELFCIDGAIEAEKFLGNFAVADSVSLRVCFRDFFDETHIKQYLQMFANSLANDASMVSELLNGELPVRWPV